MPVHLAVADVEQVLLANLLASWDLHEGDTSWTVGRLRRPVRDDVRLWRPQEVGDSLLQKETYRQNAALGERVDDVGPRSQVGVRVSGASESYQSQKGVLLINNQSSGSCCLHLLRRNRGTAEVGKEQKQEREKEMIEVGGEISTYRLETLLLEELHTWELVDLDDVLAHTSDVLIVVAPSEGSRGVVVGATGLVRESSQRLLVLEIPNDDRLVALLLN